MRRNHVANLRIAYVVGLLALAGVARADGNLPGARPIRGGEHPGFRKWVRAQARARDASIERWWSGDLDGDGEADDQALLAVREPDDPDGACTAVLLVEDAHGRRFVAEGDRPWDEAEDGRLRTEPGLPRFERTDETSAPLPGWAREPGRAFLGLRDGQLVEVRHDETDGYFVDWDALAHGHRATRDDPETFESQILLVTRDGSAAARSTVIVRGKRAWDGSGDASFTVAASQRDDAHVTLDLTLVDDVTVPAAARGDAAVAAADHFQLWIGDDRIVRLARDGDGQWFALPSSVRVSGGADRLRVVLPVEWFRFHSVRGGTFYDDDPLGEDRWQIDPAADSDGEFMASLSVAYFDVDAAGAPVESVVATAKIPNDRAPYNLVVKLHRGGRWWVAGERVPSR